MGDRIRLGNAVLTRVIEWQVDGLPFAVFPQTPAKAWREDSDEFAPTFWTEAGWRIALQIWVIEVDGLIVIVDTGAGNDKDRPRLAAMSNLRTDFLTTLRHAGYEPADIDVVVNTHLHFDHVGWNTMRDGDAWVPTFPNARYLMPEADYRHFHPANAAEPDEHVRKYFEDSIIPVDAQMQLWSDDHQISESLRLRPAPGHTPGARSCGSMPASPPCSSAT